MDRTTIIFGVILIILGVAGYFISGMVSATALIPAFFGVIFVILGRLAARENLRKHMMHAAAVLALVLIFPTIGAIPGLFGPGADISVISRSLTAIASVIFLILCVKSFIDARKERDSATP
ncbi:MAG: hypothetical protein WD266_04830 [Balneolales bacterium]